MQSFANSQKIAKGDFPPVFHHLHVFLLRLPLAVHHILFNFPSLLYLLCFVFVYSFQFFFFLIVIILERACMAFLTGSFLSFCSVLQRESTGSAGQTARLTVRQTRPGNQRQKSKTLLIITAQRHAARLFLPRQSRRDGNKSGAE